MFPPTDTTEHRPKQPSSGPGRAGLLREFETFRQEIGDLLGQGLEGHFVLIKGDQIIGTFSSWEAANTAGLRLFLLQPYLVRPILRRELRNHRATKDLSRRRIRSLDTVPVVLRAAG